MSETTQGGEARTGSYLGVRESSGGWEVIAYVDGLPAGSIAWRETEAEAQAVVDAFYPCGLCGSTPGTRSVVCLDCIKPDPGDLRVTTTEELDALIAATGGAEARKLLGDVMTPERCAEVRDLWFVGGVHLADLAEVCQRRWGVDWRPPSRSVFGRALCTIAALAHGEEPGEGAWS